MLAQLQGAADQAGVADVARDVVDERRGRHQAAGAAVRDQVHAGRAARAGRVDAVAALVVVGREGRGRQTARVAGVVLAVGAGQRILFLVVDHGRDVPAVGVQVAVAERHVGVDRTAAAMRRDVFAEGGDAALVILLRDEVDHAAHGVGAVQRRCAVAQHFDALERGERDHVQVGCRAVVGVVRQAAAVQQHEGLVLADAAQVGERCAARAGTDRLAGALLGLRNAQVGHHLFDGGDAFFLEVVGAEHRDGHGRFSVDTLDRRAGDFDAGHRRLLGILGLCQCVAGQTETGCQRRAGEYEAQGPRHGFFCEHLGPVFVGYKFAHIMLF
jgi:hypothetical protein